MRRMLSLLLAMALLALPALAGATAADEAAASNDAEPASRESFGSIVNSIVDSGKAAAQYDASTTGEVDATPAADAAPAANSLFGSIIDSGTSIEPVPLRQAAPEDAQLIEAARGVADVMYKLCAYEKYVDIYAPNDDIRALIAGIAPEDGAAPESIVVLRMSDDAVDAFVNTLSIATGGASDAGLDWLDRKNLSNMLPNMLNMQSGAEWIAAVSIATLSDAQRLDGCEPGTACVIFDYGEDSPAAAVALSIDEDGLAALTASPCRVPEALRPALLGGQGASSNAPLGMMLSLMTQTVYTPDPQ